MDSEPITEWHNWKTVLTIIALIICGHYMESSIPIYFAIALIFVLIFRFSFYVIFPPKEGYLKKDNPIYKFIDGIFTDTQQRILKTTAGIFSLACFFFGFIQYGWNILFNWRFFLVLLGSKLFLLGLLLGALWIILYRGKKIKPVTKATKTATHGSARWADSEEIQNADIFQKDGLYIGGNFQRNKIGPLLTIAGSRQGKGTCLIIPSLLVNPNGSYVVIDPKGENAIITARHQKDAGQNVFIIDPYNEQEKFGAEHGIAISGFNPFVFLKQDIHELRDNCDLMAWYLIPENPEVKDPYWNDRSRSLIKILLMHIVTFCDEEDHNFWTLYKMLRYSGEEWAGLLFDLKANKAEDGLISIAASELIGLEKAGTGSTMASIKSGAQNATTIFESPQLKKSLSANDFNPYDLTDGKTTVYFVMPERFLQTNAIWLRIAVGISLKACNSRPKKRVNFLLDEFGMLGNMQDVKRGFAFASGQNIVLWIFAQSLSQLKELYGEDGMNSFIGNAAVLQVFGVGDNFTNEYISAKLGETTIEEEDSSFTTGHNAGQESYSTTSSVKRSKRRLLTADEVETNEGIITIINRLRLNLSKLPYYKSIKDFYPQDNSDEWYEEFKQRADPPPRIVK